MNDDGALTRDTQIAGAVQQALHADPTTAPYVIDVAVEGASATLSGTVGSQEAKDAATRIAKGVNGVIDVTDALEIDQGGGGGLFGFGKRDGDEDAAIAPIAAIPGGSIGGSANSGGAAPIGLLGADAVRRDDTPGGTNDSTGE